MNPQDALPLCEREQMVKQLLRSFRVDPSRREDFIQEAHLHISHAVTLCHIDPEKGCLRQYAYRSAYIQLGRWLMFQACLLSGGRNGDRRKKLLAETKIVGDACLAFLPSALEMGPEATLLRRERQRMARKGLHRLATRKRPGGRLRAALAHLLAMEAPSPQRKLARQRRKPEKQLRQEMVQLRYEISMSQELAALVLG